MRNKRPRIANWIHLSPCRVLALIQMEAQNLDHGWVLVTLGKVAFGPAAKRPMDRSFASPVIALCMPCINISIAMGRAVRHINNIGIDGVLSLHVSETNQMRPKVWMSVDIVSELLPELLHVSPDRGLDWKCGSGKTHKQIRPRFQPRQENGIIACCKIINFAVLNPDCMDLCCDEFLLSPDEFSTVRSRLSGQLR